MYQHKTPARDQEVWSCLLGKTEVTNGRRDIADDIGDMIVVLINIAERNGLTLEDCMQRAWEDIKDRKGKMIDGIFIKEGDL